MLENQKRGNLKLIVMVRIFAIFCLSVIVGSGALAHSEMLKSEPASGATVNAGLEKIGLSFSEPVRVTLAKVTRLDDSTEMPSTSNTKPAFESNYAIAVEPLHSGEYQVNWTAVARDGHVMTGQFKFSVAD